MAINLPTDGMDSLGALIQLQMLDQMRPSVPEQPMPITAPRPDLPMDTGMNTSIQTPSSTAQGIASVLARYAENRLEDKQQPIRMETGGSVLDQLYGQLMGQIPMDTPSSDLGSKYKYEYTPYVPDPTQSAVADVPAPPLVYGPEDIAIREGMFGDESDMSGDGAVGITGDESDMSGDGAVGMTPGAPDIGISPSPVGSIDQTMSNQAFAQTLSSPVAEQAFGKDVSKGLSAISGLSSMTGIAPGIGQIASLANISPISALGLALSAVNPALGFAVGAFGQAVSAISGLGVQSSPMGQVQQFGWGNENMDMFGNPVGSRGYIANTLGYDPDNPEYSKINFEYSTVSDVDPAEIQAQIDIAEFAAAHGKEVGSPTVGPSVAEFAQSHEQEVGDPGQGGGMSSAEAATAAAESGQDGPGGHMAQGGMIDFYAQGGGISSLAYGGDPAPIGFANRAFEGMVPGNGTGMSDDVPFSIEGEQPALLSRDEYVLPADVVSQLGDGSSGAGADMLDSFVANVRQNKYGNTNQPPPNGAGLLGSLMKTV